METENKNLQSEEVQAETKIKASRNILIYDRPVGRLGFILTLLALFVMAVIFAAGFTLVYSFLSIEEDLPIIIGLLVLIFIVFLYLSVINISKRLYDIIGDKAKALFYAIAFFLINLLCGFIPVLKYIEWVFAIVVWIILVVKPGKLVK
ncbi:MAG: hypothetical protein ACI37Q_02870 [Candidatus Gastranaerophilaceae bacterium]